MKHIRHIILFILQPLLWVAGRLHMPYSRPYLKYKNIGHDINSLQIGSVILSKTAGEFANLLTPFGKWKHASMYIGNGMVIQSNQHGVDIVNVIDFFMEKKKIAIVFPQYPLDSQKVYDFAIKQVGKKYDYKLLVGANKYYCSELVYDILLHAIKNFKFKRRKIMGEETISPDDFYYAKKHFYLKLEA